MQLIQHKKFRPVESVDLTLPDTWSRGFLKPDLAYFFEHERISAFLQIRRKQRQ